MIKRVNHRVGYITNVTANYRQEYQDVMTWGNMVSHKIPISSSIDIDISLTIPGNNVIDIGRYLMGLDRPFDHYTILEEYKCLFCASPNSVVDTHCRQCGAPRSFILG